MALKTKPFDVAEYLESDNDIWEFLAEVLATGTTSDFIHALNTAARAKGMTEVAKQAGVTRASLYKSLSADGNPRFETISKIVEALGGHLSVLGNKFVSEKQTLQFTDCAASTAPSKDVTRSKESVDFYPGEHTLFS